MFSCAFCKIFKNIHFYRTPTVVASGTLSRKTSTKMLDFVKTVFSPEQNWLQDIPTTNTEK